MEKLELMVEILTDDAGNVGVLQRRLNTPAAELASTKKALDAKKIALGEKVSQCDRLQSTMSATPAVFGREEVAMRGFDEHVCSGYTMLVLALVLSYRDRQNTVPRDSQCFGEYLGGSPVLVGDDGQSLYFDEAGSDEERRCFIPFVQSNGDIVEIPPPAGSS